MKHQGLSDNQIIQTLQRQGYDSTAVFDAMNQAEAKGAAGPAPAMPPGMHPETPMAATHEGHYAMPVHPSTGQGGGEMEEIAESIIEEKFQEHMKELANITDWKDKTDERLSLIEQSIDTLRTNMENLHKAIIGKISDYDKTLMDVGTEIKAMEKVFQKVLPEFTQNVNELSRVTKGLRKPIKKK